MPAPSAPFHWEIQATGNALVAGQPVAARAFLRDSKPLVVALDELPTLGIGALFDQFLKEAGLSWPSSLIDLTFSRSSIFYVFDTAKPPALPPALPPAIEADRANITAAGLFMASTVVVSLADHDSPPIRVHVAIVRGEGVVFDGQLTRPIELFEFLQLTGRKADGSVDRDSGPRLSVVSRTSTFQFVCGIVLFGEVVLALLQISREKGERKLSATLQYDRDLGPFRRPTLAFSWMQSTGFRLDSFPSIALPQVALDFAALLRKVTQSKGCGDIGQLLFNQTVRSSFSVTPRVTTKKPEIRGVLDGSLYIVFSGYYKIMVPGDDTPIVTVALPTLAVALKAPSEFSFGGVAGHIVTTIEQNGQAVVEELWNNQAQLAKFLAVFIGKEALSKLAGKLLCEGPKELLKQFAAALAEGAGSVIAAIGSALSAAASVVGGACSSKDDDDSGGGGGGGGGGDSPPRPRRIAAPGNLALTRDGRRVTATWSAVPDAIAYVCQMWDNKPALIGQVQTVKAGSPLSVATDVPANVSSGACLFQVKALPRGSDVLVESIWASTSIVQLAAPTQVTIAVTPPEDTTKPKPAVSVTVRCAPVSNAGNYLVRILSADAAPRVLFMAPIQSGTIEDKDGRKAVAFVVAIEAFFTPGVARYAADIQAIGSDRQLDSLPSQPSDGLAIEWGIGTLRIGVDFKVR